MRRTGTHCDVELPAAGTATVSRMDNDTNAESALPGTAVEPALLPWAPLPAWKSSLLIAVTLGLYSLVWLYRTARDARLLRPGIPTGHPLLYVLAGITSFPLVIALPRLMRRYSDEGLPARGVVFFLCGLLALLGFAMFDASAETALPLASVLVPVGVVTLAFIPPQRRVNAYKWRAAAAGQAFRNAPGKYNGRQVLLLCLGIPLTLLVVMVTLVEEYSGTGVGVIDAAEYTDPDGRFSFPVRGSGWRQVKAGTWSDGTATLELDKRGSSTYALVFSHDPGTSLHDVAVYRQKDALKRMRNAECHEERTIDDISMQVASLITCEGRELGFQTTEIIAIRAAGNRALELSVSVSNEFAGQGKAVQQATEMARGFRVPLP